MINKKKQQKTRFRTSKDMKVAKKKTKDEFNCCEHHLPATAALFLRAIFPQSALQTFKNALNQQHFQVLQ